VWRPEEAHARRIGRIVQPACTKKWSEETTRNGQGGWPIAKDRGGLSVPAPTPWPACARSPTEPGRGCRPGGPFNLSPEWGMWLRQDQRSRNSVSGPLHGRNRKASGNCFMFSPPPACAGGSIGVALWYATATGFAWRPFLLDCWPAHPRWRPCCAGTGTRAARAVSERRHGDSGQGHHVREGRFGLLPLLLALTFGGTVMRVLSPVRASFR